MYLNLPTIASDVPLIEIEGWVGLFCPMTSVFYAVCETEVITSFWEVLQESLKTIMSVACKSGIISENLWGGHGWFLIRLGISSSWTACHREEYADKSHPYKTWTHVTEGVRRRSRSVGASSQPPCLSFSVRDKIQRSQKQRKRILGGDFF